MKLQDEFIKMDERMKRFDHSHLSLEAFTIELLSYASELCLCFAYKKFPRLFAAATKSAISETSHPSMYRNVIEVKYWFYLKNVQIRRKIEKWIQFLPFRYRYC